MEAERKPALAELERLDADLPLDLSPAIAKRFSPGPGSLPSRPRSRPGSLVSSSVRPGRNALVEGQPEVRSGM